MKQIEHLELKKVPESFSTASGSTFVSTAQNVKGIGGFSHIGRSFAMAVVCNVCASSHLLSVSPVETEAAYMSRLSRFDAEETDEDWDAFQGELLSGEEIDRINEHLKSTGQASA